MKINKIKGFTLVEVLAVIIIMGIILLIVIPNVSGTLLSSEKRTFTASAKGILRAADLYFAENVELAVSGTCIDVTSGDIEFDKEYQIVSGTVCYISKKATLTDVTDGSYCANGNIDNIEITEC